MDCSVSTMKVKDDKGVSRGVEIDPSGCEPVSEDLCKSGFMAPADKVSFPENALRQCCKCKSGETCSLCANPSACTDEEKKKYVAVKECFRFNDATITDEETDQKWADMEAEEVAEAEEAEEAEAGAETEVKSSGMLMYYAISVCCIISIVAFMISRR